MIWFHFWKVSFLSEKEDIHVFFCMCTEKLLGYKYGWDAKKKCTPQFNVPYFWRAICVIILSRPALNLKAGIHWRLICDRREDLGFSCEIWVPILMCHQYQLRWPWARFSFCSFLAYVKLLERFHLMCTQSPWLCAGHVWHNCYRKLNGQQSIIEPNELQSPGWWVMSLTTS